MFKVNAITNIEPFIKKDCCYFVGAMIQNSNALVLMNKNKNRIPGNYPCEAFGYTKDGLKQAIIKGY